MPCPDISDFDVADNQPIEPNVIADFQAFTSHNRAILREHDQPTAISQSAASSSGNVAANAVAEFAVVSARS